MGYRPEKILSVLRGEASTSLQLDHKLVPGIMLGSSLPAASMRKEASALSMVAELSFLQLV